MIDLCFHPGLKAVLLHAPQRPERTEVLELTVPLFYGDISQPVSPASAPDLTRLQARARQGDSIRLWTDASPTGACGLLFAVHLLQDAPGPLWAVPLAREHRRPDGVEILAAHWGEVTPKELASFAGSPVLLEPAIRQKLARQWDKLREENAPLRIVTAGEVRSAEAGYYDASILAACPDQPCTVAELIGQLVSGQLGIDDQFWAQRVRALLDSGQLRRVEEGAETPFWDQQVLRNP